LAFCGTQHRRWYAGEALRTVECQQLLLDPGGIFTPALLSAAATIFLGTKSVGHLDAELRLIVQTTAEDLTW